MITIHYFAGLKEVTGIAQEQADLSGRTVEELGQWAAEKYPGILAGASRIAVNEEYALPEDLLENGDIAAFIPPVSGG
ncbi:molybdopterin converting factor subunit 1 [Planococcus sp. ISL-109]|uniref:molybdopterin converting factor subunit 1 n=1 Tax=Planococcus sp. ISL-109 TaxID=2819166 RepID=UPI001BE6EB42|nr:molybdopterin converting factor subunit 1 [Planococcus sp. ISL-109]MBT2582869.1 molybdopterin converting factor subunit 1 [Planococcus sp. ISL-109]